jgi:hypothetical protein
LPINPYLRIIASLETMTGIFFVAVVVARLTLSAGTPIRTRCTSYEGIECALRGTFMRKFRLAAALILFSGFALTQLVFSQSASRIDASAFWQVTPQFLATAPEACRKKTGDSNGDCLVAEMAKAGAPSAAVTFTRALYKQSTAPPIFRGLSQPE